MPLMDTSKMEAFVGQVVKDMAVSMSGVMVHLGHKLGLLLQRTVKSRL